MRKLMRGAVVAAVVLAAASVAAEPQQARGPFDRWGQVWGTWVWRIHVSPTIANPSLVTLHIDGTVSVTDGNMFGSPTAASRRYLTPAHGVWVRTGWQSVGGTSLYLISDATTGALVAWGRARTSLTFADDFDSFQGRVFVETLPCAAGPPVSCPDPLSADAKWAANPNMPPDGFPVSATRLERVPAGPLP